jgi:hypothetical protein
MPRLRFRGSDDGPGPEPGALPFPRTQPGPDPHREHQPEIGPHAAGDGSMGDALEALELVSRRMEDLARALDCLGYFDDDDRPRAA